MTWLKKAGLTILKIIGIVTSTEPIIQNLLPNTASPAVGKTVQVLTEIAGVVTTAEGMIGAISAPDAKTGAQKLTASVPFVSQLIQQSELLVNKKIKDEAGFTKACTELTSAVADLLNSLESA